jgi:DNA-binding response OmpR family regulator
VGSEQILLVEAEAKTRRMLQVSLEQLGYAVSTARDGAEALAQLELLNPSLLVSSTDLPKLDGYALVRRMKNHAEWSNIPVIFMIAGESIEDKIRGLELGVEEYLHKPVFVRELLGRVQVLLARRVRDHLSESAAGTRVAASLSDLAPIDLFESMETGRQTGTLRIRKDGRTGEVIFDRGEMVDARLKGLRGEEAVFRLLTWIDGTFEVELGPTEAERTIEGKTRGVIEAGIRHAAEFQRLLLRLPKLDTLLEVDGGQLVAMQAEIPDEINGILELVDGKRSIHDVLDESPFDDLSTLSTLVKLSSEGLLVAAAPASIGKSVADKVAEKVQDAPSELREALSQPAEPPPPVRHAESEEDEAIYRVDTTRPPAFKPQETGVDPREWTRDLREDQQAHQPAEQPASARMFPDPVAPVEVAERHKPLEIPGAPGSELELDEEPSKDGEPSNGDAAHRELSESASRRAQVASAATREAAAALAASAAAARASDKPPPSSDPARSSGPSTPRTAPTGTQAVLGKVSLARVAAPPMDDVSTYTWLRDLHGDPVGPAKPDEEIQVVAPAAGAPAAGAPAAGAPAAPAATVPTAEEPPNDGAEARRDGASSEPAHSDDPLLSQTVKSRVDRAALEGGAASDRAAVEEEDAAPDSGPTELSQSGVSGVSNKFFSSMSQEHQDALEDAVPPSSRDAPVYLSDAQIARRERGKRVVAGVVGIFAVGVVAVVASRLVKGGDETTAPTPTQAATTEPTAPPTPSQTAAPPPTASEVASEPSAAPSASAAAEDDEELPDVEDPFKELQQLANMGKYNKAIAMGKAAIKKDPENADAYYLLALCYEELGKRQEAQAIYGDCAANAKKGQYLSLCKSSAPK